jgi:hypothetical protein
MPERVPDSLVWTGQTPQSEPRFIAGQAVPGKRTALASEPHGTVAAMTGQHRLMGPPKNFEGPAAQSCAARDQARKRLIGGGECRPAPDKPTRKNPR